MKQAQKKDYKDTVEYIIGFGNNSFDSVVLK